MMDINEIKAQVRVNQYTYTHHAEIERRADELTFAQIERALLNGEILEQYPGTGAVTVACSWVLHKMCRSTSSAVGVGKE